VEKKERKRVEVIFGKESGRLRRYQPKLYVPLTNRGEQNLGGKTVSETNGEQPVLQTREKRGAILEVPLEMKLQ